ncbi:MAG: sn-glycerol-1-phosphate dehydrogenase [bacterium]|nr:sn-glycerol-1-phosphate dehydrogenase [bacterium]
MDTAHTHFDPTDVAGINERIQAWAAGGGSVKPIDIDRVVVADHAIEQLADLTRALADGGTVTAVMDHTAMVRGGQDLKALVERALAGKVALSARRLPDEPGAALHADIEAARGLADELTGSAAVVAVGSGSVTDVVKYAVHLNAERGGRRPAMISFPTAASVTAYTSALAVLTIDGVKRTLPASAPQAVVCDLTTLADAPRAMTLAGFGDVLARSVSYGDWFLAAQLGMDDGFSEAPGRMLAAAEQAMIDQANAVARGERDGVRSVLDGLLLAGMAMSVVDQTAPVSGWEHVISHYLDLTAPADGRRLALHGAQVGVATLVAARAYRRAWPDLDLDRLARDVDLSTVQDRVRAKFARLDPGGRLLDELWHDLVKKLNRWNAAGAARRSFIERKRSGEYDAFLRANVRSSAAVADALTRATAPHRFADLTEPIPDVAARAAVSDAHLVRARFTLGDLLDRAGWLDDANVAALLAEHNSDE